MAMDDDFTPMDHNNPHEKPKRRRIQSGVIKSHRKHLEGTLHLEPHEEDTESGVEFFQPIVEGDTIVGVVHRCSCGKTAELRFQYSE